MLQDWVERDLLILKQIKSSDNFADSMTKPVTRDLYTRHADYILGKHIPHYSHLSNSKVKAATIHTCEYEMEEYNTAISNTHTEHPYSSEEIWCSTEQGEGITYNRGIYPHNRGYPVPIRGTLPIVIISSNVSIYQ